MILKCLSGLNPVKTHGSKFKTSENGKTIPHENGVLDQDYENDYVIGEYPYGEKNTDKYGEFSYGTGLQ